MFLVHWRPLVVVQEDGGSVASFLRSAAPGGVLPRDLDQLSIPSLSDVSGRVTLNSVTPDVILPTLLSLSVESYMVVPF